MSLLAWCRWLEQTPLATAVSESIWLFPFIEGSHILALPLSVGMILMFDLRLLGVAFRNGPAATMISLPLNAAAGDPYNSYPRASASLTLRQNAASSGPVSNR